MTEFEFVDLSKVAKTRANSPILAEFREALKCRRREWAKWPFENISKSTAMAMASRINTDAIGCPKLFKGGEFEGLTVSGVLYVRYVGDAA